MSRKKNRKKKPSGNSGAKPSSTSLGWLLAFAVIAGGYLYFSAGRSDPATSADPSPVVATDAEVPAFHRDPETAKPFPALLPPTRYEHPVVSRAYAIAHEIPEVLAQQPCYCYCDKFGHGSLLDCWASDHGAG